MIWTRIEDQGESWLECWELCHGDHVYWLVRKSDLLIEIEIDGFPIGRFTGDRANMALAKEYVEKHIVDAREEAGE